MARRNESPPKAAMREMMRSYLKDNDISIKDGFIMDKATLYYTLIQFVWCPLPMFLIWDIIVLGIIITLMI